MDDVNQIRGKQWNRSILAEIPEHIQVLIEIGKSNITVLDFSPEIPSNHNKEKC